MDARKLTELLRATIDPAQQKEAEGQLNQVRERIIRGEVTPRVTITSENVLAAEGQEGKKGTSGSPTGTCGS